MRRVFEFSFTLLALLLFSAWHGQAADHELTLTAASVLWEIAPGRSVSAYAYNGTVPGPTLRASPGDVIRVHLVNRLPEATTIHWHGVPVPNGMDGVPGVTAPVVPPGGSFTYEFRAPAPGTYWYHPHHDSAAQIARGLYGLLIVDPPGDVKSWDRDVPLVIGEFAGGMGGAGRMGGSMGTMGGMGAILLINGKTAPAIPEVRVKQGEKILFRMVNTGNMVHPMHVHGLHWEILATDGFDLSGTYSKDTLPLNAGERYDGLLKADNPGRWLVHCHNLQHVGESAGAMTGLVFELVVE